MYSNKEILKRLNEAQLDNPVGTHYNLVDISIQDRSTCIVNDIEDGAIDLALKRIKFFIFADTSEKPGEYIHRLILNRVPTASTRLITNTAPLLYLLPMIRLGRLDRGDYNKLYDKMLSFVQFHAVNNELHEWKDIISFYDANSGQLGILSYLY